MAIRLIAQEDGSLRYVFAPNLPITAGKGDILRTARAVVQMWRPIGVTDFQDRGGIRRTIIRLACLLAHVFEVRKSSLDEVVRAGDARLAQAVYSLFGRGFYDVRLFGPEEVSWNEVERHPDSVLDIADAVGILGTVARARKFIQDGRYRNRWAALIFYHITTRPLAFVDLVMQLSPIERKAVLRRDYLDRLPSRLPGG